MDDNLDRLVNRRSFLRTGSCAALGLAGLTSQVFTMRALGAAIDGMDFSDHKALVCIFLFGGNDNGNTLMPFDGGDQNLADYAEQRTTLALTAGQLGSSIIAPTNTQGRRFALHPALRDVRDLFQSGDIATVANAGTLLFPMTKEQYQNQTVPRPPQLQAHNFQQEQWQLSRPDAVDGLGWGGRVADMLQANGANADATVSMNISIAGESRFLAGKSVTPYAVGRNGPPTLNLGRAGNRAVAEQAFLDMMAVADDPTHPAGTPMRKVLADVTRRSVNNAEIIDALLDSPTQINTPVPSSSLADQLAMVARMIEFGGSGLSHQRQVFFVSMGGFDNHDGLIQTDATDGNHAARLLELNDAMKWFHTALRELGKLDDVTTFTASDFGRTYRSNGDGSDHAWGAPQFVMGGNQVNGRRLYGSYPNITLGGPDDVKTNGTFLPSTSVDAYAFEMAKWMGVPLSDMETVLPHINRFVDPYNASTHLGILN